MKKLSIILLAMALALVLSVPAMGASVNLTWTPPTVNCDSSDLNDLSGYVILWGDTAGGPYTSQHDVDDPFAVSASVDVGQVENVTLYFVTVSVDMSGNRTDDIGGCGYSNEITVPFPRTYPAAPTGVAGAVVP
jgi:hypothetical protein